MHTIVFGYWLFNTLLAESVNLDGTQQSAVQNVKFTIMHECVYEVPHISSADVPSVQTVTPYGHVECPPRETKCLPSGFISSLSLVCQK